MDITLPQGISVVTESGYEPAMFPGNMGGIYPYSSDRWGNISHTHSFSYALQPGGNLRVSCFSSKNEDFTATSGPLFSVYVKASPYAKPGENEVRLTGLNLTTAENAQKYIPEGDLNTGTLTVGTEVSIPLTIKAENQYGTCFLPFALDALPEGVQAFVPGPIEGDELPLHPVDKLDAYTPYILYAPTGCDHTLKGTLDASLYPDAPSVTANGLTGLLVPQEVTSGYILQNKGNGPCFYPVGSTPFSLLAGRCYLSLPAESGVRLNFVQRPTGLVEVSASTPQAEHCFDLLGRRVNRLEPGRIYLSHQRKVFINR